MKDKSKILMYHSIGSSAQQETGAGLYSVPVEKFREQMKFIKQGQSPAIEGSPCRTGTVPAITFDDGLEDNYTNAYPILKEFGLKAYFFILAGRVGEQGYMSWQQIRELKDAGMIIGSHGMSHRILTTLSAKEIDYELRESKRILEDNLKQKIGCFSIPRGFYNAKIIKKLREVGYTAVFTSNPRDWDGFKLGRISVKGDWNVKYFKNVLDRRISLKKQSEELVKASAKRIFGARGYDRIRTKILTGRTGQGQSPSTEGSPCGTGTAPGKK